MAKYGRWRWFAALLALVIVVATACRSTPPPSGEETLASFALNAPSSVAAGEAFALSVEAVGSQGTAPFESFSGTVGLSASAGTISPEQVELTDGAGSVDATLSGAEGEVTITASNGEASGSTTVTIGGDLRELPGEPEDSAAEAVPLAPFEPRPDDYADDAPGLEGVYVSFNTLLIAFELGTTVGEANALLDDIDALIVGGIPGVEGEAPGILFVRVPMDDHAAMADLLERLRAEPIVEHVARDALLETAEVPAPNGGTPAGWTWQDTPAGGNYGLELSRVPQLWNLNRAVEKAGGAAVTGVLDVGFEDDHEDLTYFDNQTPGNEAQHGTHVAGTIAADYDNGVGVEGVNPFADLVVRTRDASGFGGSTTLDVRESFGESHVFGFFDLVRSRPELRAVNISLGYNWGPAGLDQDNNTNVQQLVENQGALFGLGLLLTALFNDNFDGLGDLPMIAVAAGNDSNSGFGTQQAQWANPFAYAALNFDLDGVVVVESVANAPTATGGATRSNFSNVDGHVSAPGTNVLSTDLSDGYTALSGTSMATPHVAGLIGYLVSVDPTLSHAELRELLTANAVAVDGGASDRIDAFAAALDIDRLRGNDDVLRMLLDVDDGTLDGNQRLSVGTSLDFTGEDADGDGGIGDGAIDMSDFRRFRDGLLQVEDVAGLELDGSPDHPKKDVNGDGQVGSAAQEGLYPRGDFNGDGELSRTASRYVPGAVDDTVTDLQVLQLLFDDANYAAAELPDLLDSGDIEIWPRRCLDRSDVARVESTVALNGFVEERTHAAGATPRHVYTVPAFEEVSYGAQLQAFDAADVVVFETATEFTVAPGSDFFWDPTCSTEAPESPGGGQGESWGDPHQITFDRLKYDFQAVGEFVFLESDAGDLTVQVRQEPWGSSNRVSVNTAVATEVDGQRVAIYSGETPPVWIEGVPTEIADGGFEEVGNGAVYRGGDLYTVVYPGDDQLRVRLRSGRMDVRAFLTTGRAGAVAGLLGNADGDRGDDLALRGGTVLPQPVSFDELYGAYADSWRIAEAESLFDYGAGEDTATFTDPGFPSAYASTGDLTPAEYDGALQVCEAEGVTQPILLNACILDVGLTGDQSFAHDAAATGTPEQAAEVTPETRTVGLLHSEDTTAADVYATGLGDRGFEVTLVTIGSTESANASMLQAYELLVIDPLTGSGATWDGNEKVVNAVVQSERPVLALGDGGYAFLGQISSPIGYANGLHSTGLTGFRVTSPLHPSLSGPRPVEAEAGSVEVTSTGMANVAIYAPDPGSTVELVGRLTGDHYVAIVDTASAGAALWGFKGVPSSYTEDGWNALANLGSYLLGLP